jgi:CRISPR-associated endoribonuclease Cas6
LQSDEPLYFHYQYPLQLRGLIYSLLPSEYSEFLHDRGFRYEKRQFKLFTFSRIFGRRLKGTAKEGLPLVFDRQIFFYLASPIKEILEYVATATIRNQEIRIGINHCTVQAIEVEKEPIFDSVVKIKMMSPMTIRSTLLKADGSKKSYYYSPYEKEFSELMLNNLRKKYQLVYGREIEGELEILPKGRNRERPIRLDQGFMVRAWDGIYELKGTPELIQLSYSTGLGEKNSGGFGMWRVVEEL